MITCKSGVTIRTSIVDIREAGRATQGVKLIRLDEEDEIAATSIIGDQGEEEDATASSDGEAKPASDGESNLSDDAQASDDQTNTPAE
jgi:DNA gyrase subunit A